MSLRDKINMSKLPVHIAVIMDGNGRWAALHGHERVFGHQKGVEPVRNVVEAAAELGIGYLTLYAFSTENWGRPDDEVSALMELMVQSLNNEKDNLLKNNIRLIAIGDFARLNENVRTKLFDTINLTSGSTGLTLILALSYSSKWEITEAVRKLVRDVNAGVIDREAICEEEIEKRLTTYGIPDPDLMIRTSGELRISNFLLWQLAYSEFYFTDILWPDFGKEDLYGAIVDFQNRVRRFGKTSEQILEK
ncbi:MAG TPA: isoprenyl transferase [Bacteroidales bacterium]|jgi:undecaprenyl diphosphate synthase|nr:isoprenyl transferase [Bacteroidales bacterium]HPM86627.1 isoprenyl transferase [Bacteroidales bacterium]HQM67786.1 isoprenyl transferase [Bacteroidales bacterium]